jgi:NAD(P)-dependent dehydrogenase (short-subunit alcohol dehydrogenase family)
LASARLFLECGAPVVVGARHEASLATALESLAAGERVVDVASDVSTVTGCQRVAAAAEDAFGGIDVLFTNAGVYGTAPVEEMQEGMWDEIIDSNLKGTSFCVQAALPWLQSNGGVVLTWPPTQVSWTCAAVAARMEPQRPQSRT